MTTAALLLGAGLVLISGVRLKAALDRLEADMCEWANATGHENDQAAAGDRWRGL